MPSANPFSLLAHTFQHPLRWVLLLLLLLSTPPALAQKKQPELEPPPPLPQPIQVRVFAGESVEIHLSAQGRDAKDATFLLRSHPRIGKLSAIQPLEPGKASVIYTHQKNAPLGQDQFTYAAKTHKSPISAPATVHIHIVQRPADPIIPQFLDFGTVFLGSTATRPLRIENRGGSPFQTTLTSDPPSLIPQNSTIVVPPKSSLDIPIHFKPTLEGEFLGKIHLSSPPNTSVSIRANSRPPIRVSPNEITLPQPNHKTNLLIENFTPSSIEVRLQHSPGILTPSSISIPPKSEKALQIEVDPSFPSGTNGTLSLSTLDFKLQIPFQLLPLPPQLEILPSQQIHLGSIDPQNPSPLTLQIRNTGGVPAHLSIQTPSWLHCHSPHDLTLLPNHTQTLLFTPEPPSPGELSGSIYIHGLAEPIPILVQAHALPPPPATPPPPSLSPKTPPAYDYTPVLTQNPLLLEPLHPLNTQPPNFPLQDFRILAVSTNAILIDWHQSLPANSTLELQARTFEITPNQTLAIAWKKIPNVHIAPTSNNRVTALIHSMPTASRLLFRIVATDPLGREIFSSGLLSAETATPPPPKKFPWLLTLTLLSLTLTATILFLKRRKSPPSDPLAQKIKNLESI